MNCKVIVNVGFVWGFASLFLSCSTKHAASSMDQFSEIQKIVDSAAAQIEANYKIVYPVTEKIPTTKVYFGTPVEDPYQWLENDTSEATEEWVKAQNITTQNYLLTIPYRDSLKSKLKALYNYPKLYSPMKAGKYILYKKNEGLQNQPIIYCKVMWDGTAYELLNPNQLVIANGRTTVPKTIDRPKFKH